MAFDLLIFGGLLVDGTGAAPRLADVAVQDGTIAAIGDLSGHEATVRLDARGHIVTPGFVDLHTHFDGQISWDDDLMPSSIHGTTTVVMGNCGVGFAPCRAADRDALIALMEGVEDIPGSALVEGLQWDWETFPEYMDALDKRPKTIDYAVQVPHDALRVFVMGERGIGVILGLEATFQPFIGFPSYKRIAHLPLALRVTEMRKPEFRQQLLSEKSERITGDGSSVPPIADWLLAQIDTIAFRFFTLGENPNYEPKLSDSIGARAKARGVSALEEILDALLGDDGRALLYFPVYNYAGFSLDNVREMITHPLALPGLSDSGAHVGTICDASFPSFLLAYWARDRKEGRIPVERVVQMITSDTANYLGLKDRGELRPGLRADINVIAHDRMRLYAPKMVADLPAGGKRLIQSVDGYRATFVRGELIVENGELTGRRPGRLVRFGTAPATAT